MQANASGTDIHSSARDLEQGVRAVARAEACARSIALGAPVAIDEEI